MDPVASTVKLSAKVYKNGERLSKPCLLMGSLDNVVIIAATVAMFKVY